MKRFENIERAEMEFEGKYDIPVLEPLEDIESDIEFIPFNFVKSCKNRENYGVHFFIDDYQFERLWEKPQRYCEMLQTCKCVFTPDFSMYVNVPRAIQIWKHYQKQWFGQYMQTFGIKVIPTLGWSDESSFDFCFDGIPKNNVVAVSSVGTQNNTKAKELFKKGFEKAVEILQPTKIFFYGQINFFTNGLNIVHLPHSFDVKFKSIK